jgi:ubiquinone/menaquinone biosynthesis C-methylase UbiE
MTGQSPNFTGRTFTNKVEGFDSPTKLPVDEAERAKWQSANKAWWERSPMRYDWRQTVGHEGYTREYFVEIDRRFIASSKPFLPWRAKPFDQLIPYADLPGMDVLEIGVGQGTHAQLMAPHCRSFTGIDLTQAASQATAKRFELFGIAGKIMQMDAESMNFAAASFDYIWSWGVIHHSANTQQVLREMRRVLRPGGRALVMVYHRNWWNFYVIAGLLKGVVQGQMRDFGGLHGISQAATDGALARYYRISEWRDISRGLFAISHIRICGLKNDVIPLPSGRLKSWVERATPNMITRFLTNTLRMGSFLVADMRRL